MSSEIKNLILQNDELSKSIELLLLKIEVKDDDKREMLLIGFLNNSMVHFRSMNLLIEQKLYNSAFALVRVFFENIVKGRFVYMFFEEAKIDTMYQKDNWESIFKKEPNLGDMCKEIDKKIGEEFYEDIKKTAYNKMNDFTHTGAYQIASNFNIEDGLVEPSYNETLIKDTLKSNCKLMHTFALFSLERLGLNKGFISKDEMDEILAKKKE